MTGQSSGFDVCFLQPYVPEYRRPLFDALQRSLHARRAEFQVRTPALGDEESARSDSASPSYQLSVPGLRVSVRDRVAYARRLPPRRLRGSDARVRINVAELAAGNLDAYRLLVRARRDQLEPLILWGHGVNYLHRESGTGDSLEAWLARRASHVFTYADRGREHLICQGTPPSKVTAVGNAGDSDGLRRRLISVLPSDSAALSASLGLGTTNVLFVGSLTTEKRIDFLLRAAQAAYKTDPDFRLVVAGRGPHQGLVRRAVLHGAVVYVDQARDELLAQLETVCSAVWMPGRVGLVAVDALALGLPVHTAQGQLHGPEIEFCRDDELIELPDDAEKFAAASLSLIRRSRGRQGGRQLRADIPTAESVAANMMRAFEEVAESCLRGAKGKFP